MRWAVEEWHVITGEALASGVLSTRPDGPARLSDLSLEHFLVYVEFLARRKFGDEALDDIYAASAPPPPFIRTEERRRQIQELESMFNQ